AVASRLEVHTFHEMSDHSGTAPEPQLAMRDIVRFVRQLSHDIRNHLNAAELQSAYLGEIANDAEVKDEIKRLRAMLSEATSTLQRLSATMAEVKLNAMEYGAADFVEDVQGKLAQQFPEMNGNVRWKVELEPGATFKIDPQVLQQAV